MEKHGKEKSPWYPCNPCFRFIQTALNQTQNHNILTPMATAYHNLFDYDFNSVPNAEKMKFGIVVSEWNYNITGALLEGAVKTLKNTELKKKTSSSKPFRAVSN